MNSLIVLMTIILSLNCNESENMLAEYSNSVQQIDDRLIERGRAGAFCVGTTMNQLKGYQITEKMEMVEDGNMELCYSVVRENIVLYPKYNAQTEFFTNVIAEVKVRNPNYKTAKGLRVGATIEEFVKSYGNASFYYSYISGSFWIETPALSKVQFQLDESGFVNREVDLMKGDRVTLKQSDFKANTKIQSIRIF